jgi:WD repeat-containing protein 68
VDDASCKFASDPQLAFQHPYPATKIMFMPDKEGAQPDLLATTGDYLRIWQLKESGTQLVKLLNNVRLLTSAFLSTLLLSLLLHAFPAYM